MTKDFLTFSRVIETDHWTNTGGIQISQIQTDIIHTNTEFQCQKSDDEYAKICHKNRVENIVELFRLTIL